ncbi:hypothetical protein PO124_24520 [Bacillus licheniformis]|nr:hypothetical protein [Bacillus licheniformis]
MGFADAANALMMIPNLIALVLLWKVIRAETDDFFCTTIIRKTKSAGLKAG